MSFYYKINLERLRRPITKEVLLIQSGGYFLILLIVTIEQGVLVEVHNPYSVHLLEIEKKYKNKNLNLKMSCAAQHLRKPKEIACSGSLEKSINFLSLLTLVCSISQFVLQWINWTFEMRRIDSMQKCKKWEQQNHLISSNLNVSNINCEGICILQMSRILSQRRRKVWKSEGGGGQGVKVEGLLIKMVFASNFVKI